MNDSHHPGAATAINQRIRNPASGLAFRLMADADHWRITRSAPTGDTVSLTHLRGTPGPAEVPADLIAHFAAGKLTDPTAPADPHAVTINANPHHAFRRTLLADIKTTSERLARLAADAMAHYHRGRPGLRPHCSCLLDSFMDASRHLHDAWQTMAILWEDHFGRTDLEVVPDWMGTVWEQGIVKWDRRGALAGLTTPLST